MSLNPLLVPEILSSALKFLDLNDLLRCRQVCRVWNCESGLYLGTKKKICICSYTKLTAFLELHARNGNHPFRTYEFQGVHLDLEDKNVFLFFQICGPSIHHLTFSYDKDNDTLFIRAFRDILLYYTPNLKSLILRQLPTLFLKNKFVFPPEGDVKFRHPLLPNLKSLTVFSDKDYNSEFIRNLVREANNLEEILIEYGDEPGNFKKTILEVLFSCATELQNLNTLKYFMHDPGSGSGWAWTSEECDNLSKMKLNLTTLKFHPGGMDQQQSVHYLLKGMSKSLETLKLRVHDPLDCPKMECLQTLIIYDYEGSLGFLDYLPALRHLGLCEYFPSKNLTSENLLPKKSHQLLSLNLYGTCSISTHILRLIAKIFPNLRKLNLWHVNNDKLQIIIEEFPLLEELVMNVTEVSDSAITGIPTAICEQIERLKNYDEYVHHTEKHRTKPFIGNLTYLRRLELHGASLADWQWSPLSDVSVILGLAHLSQLTSLSLYEFKWITDASIEAIATNLRLMYFKFDPRVFSEEVVEDMRLKCPDLRIEYVVDDFDSYDSYTYYAHL